MTDTTPVNFLNLKQMCDDMIAEAGSLTDKMREAKIKEFGLLDKQFDSDFHDFVFIAAKICNARESQINLIDENHQIIKSRLNDDKSPLIGPKSDSICACTTVICPTVTVIPDAKLDERVNKTSWVKNDVIRFYAGAPLMLDDIVIGSICVFDNESRDLSKEQQELLAALARLVSSMLHKVKQ